MLTTEIASEITKLSGRLDIAEGIRRALDRQVGNLIVRFNHLEDRLAILEKHCLSSNTLESIENCITCKQFIWKRPDGMIDCRVWSNSKEYNMRCQHYRAKE